jgi:hypothetical protein
MDIFWHEASLLSWLSILPGNRKRRKTYDLKIPVLGIV